MLGYSCSDVHDRWVDKIHYNRRRIFTSKTNPNALVQPEVKQLAIIELIHKEYPLMKLPHVLVSAVHYYINGKIKLSSTVLTLPCLNNS